MEDELKWKCCYCGKGFRLRWELIEHKHNECSEKPEYHWICKYCGNEFKTERKLRSHLESCELRPPKRVWKYDKCNAEFPTRVKLNEHKRDVHKNDPRIISEKVKSEHTCRFCHKTLFVCDWSFTFHENHCECNPNRKIVKGHKLNGDSRKKISEAMKKAHEEGKACKWNPHVKSYPEEWFTDVIENEFEDKDYRYNFQVSRYRLDFAWPKKMRYIEIDGDQHYRTQEAIEHDRVRTEYLEKLGWTLLRRSWSYIIKNKDEFIDEVKRFIDDVENLPLEVQYRDKRKDTLNRVNSKNKSESKVKCKVRMRKSRKLPKSNARSEYRSKMRSIYPQLFTKTGGYLHVNVDEYLRRRDLILNSGVDMTKFKWKSEVAKITGLHKRWIDGVVKKFPDDFKDAYKDAHVGKTMKSGVK